MAILVITEKPSVAKDIAKVLGANIKTNNSYNGNNYTISWAIGHLISLFNPEDYDKKLKRWSLDSLPILPAAIKTKPIQKTIKQYTYLKELMNNASFEYIVCATDSGREGELIFRYIYNLAGCKTSVKRLWISSLTDSAIKKGFSELRPSGEYDNLYFSAKCRSEADWLVGINASRAYSLRYNSLLSVGRVQTPTLSLIVERNEKIKNFVSENYFELEAEFLINNIDSKADLVDTYKGIWFNKTTTETKIPKNEDAQAIADRLKDASALVTSFEKKEKQELHPLLFDLTELQKEANNLYSYTAKKTLDIAQRLYENKKVITYPRTDSKFISDDMKSGIKSILKALNINEYAEFITPVLEENNLKLSSRVVNDTKITDHHAIIPTGKLASSLTPDEANVFDLIVRRFIAVFYPPYRYFSCKCITESNNESFVTKGIQVIDLGFKKVIKKKQKDKEEYLKDIKTGTESTIKNLKILKKKTNPPKPYTEATLLSDMENAGRLIESEELKEHLKNSGLGTPATRAAIIERLIEVNYVTRKNKNLIPTEKGIKLIQIVPSELKSPVTTAKWEKALNKISDGKMNPNKFNQSIKRYVVFLVNDARQSNVNIQFEQENQYNGKGKSPNNNYLGKCPVCDGGILENSKAFYCVNWKKLNCKFTIWKNQLENYGVVLNSKIIKSILLDKKVDKIKIILPQTSEHGYGSLILKTDNSGVIELMNFTKIVTRD